METGQVIRDIRYDEETELVYITYYDGSNSHTGAFHPNGTQEWDYVDEGTEQLKLGEGRVWTDEWLDQEVIGRNKYNGSIEKRYSPDGYGTGTAYHDGVVVVGDGNNDIHAYNTTSNNQMWTHGGGGGSDYHLAANQDGVFSDANGGFVMVDYNGNTVWSRSADPRPSASAKGVVGVENGNLIRYDTSDGSEMWNLSDSSWQGRPRALEDNIWLARGADNNRLTVLDYNGNIGWEKEYPQSVSRFTYDSENDRWFYVTDADGDGNPEVRMDDTSEITFTSPSVTVENQNGEPVENATVESIAVDTDQLESDIEDMEAESDRLLAEASNPEPPEWDPDLSVSNDIASDADTFYPTAHTREDMGLEAWSDSPNLKPSTLQFDEGETVHLYARDPDGGGLDGVSTAYPGGVADDATWTIEQLDHTGDTVETREVDADQTYTVGTWPARDEHNYATADLPTGFYRVTPEVRGTEGVPIIITVGDPAAIIEDKLETESNRLSERAQQTRDLLNDGTFVRQKVTTNESGYAELDSFPSSVEVVSVQAYKGPNIEGTPPSELTITDLREYQEAGYNGSVYVSESPKRVSPEELDSGVTVQMTEFETTPYSDLGRYENMSAWVRDMIENGTFTDLLDGYLDTSDEDMDQLADQLEELKDQNSAIRERYDELVSDLVDGDDDSLTPEEQAELIKQIISELEGDLEADDPETIFEDGTVSATIPWNGDIDPDAVAVEAHFPSLGTSQTVSDEYVSVNKRTGQGDVLEITDYPVPADAKAVSFGVTVSGEDGEAVGDTDLNVRNPDFSGQYLTLNSVSVSTLRPGPDERVTATPRVSEDSVLIQNVTARVNGPNGEVNTTTVDGGNSVRFTTDGAGTHRVLFEIEDQTGETWTETITLAAGEQDIKQPPSVRVRDGFTGEFAIVSDGLIDGSVSSSGNQFSASAVADSEDIPSSVHYYASEVDNSRTEVTLRVLQSSGSGPPESARKHVKVFYHTKNLPEGTILYRDGNQPLERGGETAYGSVNCENGSGGCTIATYTDGDGTVDLTVNPNPSIIDRAFYYVRSNSPVDLSFSVTPLGVADTFSDVPTGALPPTPGPLGGVPT